MKIAVISTPVFPCPPPGYSGLEQIAWQQAKGLAAKGHEVALIAPEGSSCEGATVISNGKAGTWDEKAAYSSYWQHLPAFDVVLDHTWNKWALILKQEGRLKAPVLNVLHAPVNTMMASLPPVEKPCFVCISQDQANHFEALFGRAARVCHNGVDPDFYRPMGIRRSKRFLFLARFSTIKGPDLAIEACKKAGVGLDLVGDTSITNEPEFFEKCRRMADGEQIRIVGGVPRGETVWWYSQAWAMIHPNQRFREPFGLAPVEAMMCSCPVIAWNHGAMRETVPGGRRRDIVEQGWLVDSAEDLAAAVEEAKGEDLHRKDLDEDLRALAVKTFSVQKMVDRCEELCKEAIQTGGW